MRGSGAAGWGILGPPATSGLAGRTGRKAGGLGGTVLAGIFGPCGAPVDSGAGFTALAEVCTGAAGISRSGDPAAPLSAAGAGVADLPVVGVALGSSFFPVT